MFLLSAKLTRHQYCRFPGAQPISFSSRHIEEELMVEDYFVSEKADGVRCMMFTTTLQDGQVESYLSGQESRELWFLLFDAMVVDGKNLCDRPYTKRLGYLREFVLIPHLEYLKRNPNQKHNYPFEIVQKHLELSYKVQKVFDMMSKCHHKTDGVIYTSSIAPYVSGTCSKMLKWKPSEENTVDFKILDMKLDGSYPLFRIGILENRNQYSDFGIITLSEETSKEWAKNPPVGRIIECRFRDDKDSANHISTYNSIMISINDNVQKDDLIKASNAIEATWKQRTIGNEVRI
ncbi:hypothetical protein BATDEDRAFT_25993 [Batrachochytrium dendrobatidis JAM81]|uniref:mRNA guanylyltransferase n=1 Tax=Batrachochytrium dendrobatidis (strain JAM81 / FGSC 10211) TaxID=684364 RepID=F4P687_BATDJ|nr:uncharacterized protein BATDEDRAFT_25993 [Batrachochytrium dendrobatidis JAM81]EGF79306.1 hypothetical protein BATDEDRAFT_25993 [Batrachochytrium dendrobatidis JAM81]|eukprot:XP_006679925.1 hypothetical protein BATDEDRAFT_25993 [Batrachochytrium dendrobatidis JAM81]